jgi:hypothetical protein
MTATASAFRSAVESRDLDAGLGLLSDDVVFHSPAVHRPYEGKETVSALLRLVLGTFENFRYTDELAAGDGTHALIFRAEVGGRELEGMDLLRFNDAGEIADFTVMVRPASGLMALGAAMGPKVEAAGLKPS